MSYPHVSDNGQSPEVVFAALKSVYDQIPEFTAVADYPLEAKYKALTPDDDHWCAFVCQGANNQAERRLGFVNGYNRDGAFYVWLLGVVPGERGKNWARFLLNEAIAEARRRMVPVVSVKTHAGTPGMVHLLEATGFRRREPVDANGRFWMTLTL